MNGFLRKVVEQREREQLMDDARRMAWLNSVAAPQPCLVCGESVAQLGASEKRGEALRVCYGCGGWRKHRKLKAVEAKRAYKALWQREWRRANPDKAHALEKAAYQREKADAARYARRRTRETDAQRKRRAVPAGTQRSRELSLKYYHQRAADPAKRAALRAYQRARYHARKEAA